MSLRETSPGVFYSDSATVSVCDHDLAFLLQEARKNDKHRARICVHPDVSDAVHEMVICLLDKCYIRPHMHRKAESLHLIEGRCDLVLLAPDGQIMRVVTLGSRSKETRFIRLAPQVFHTLVIRSEYMMFHETTRGPFQREDTVFADWAPAEGEEQAREYVTRLDQSISDRGKSS